MPSVDVPVVTELPAEKFAETVDASTETAATTGKFYSNFTRHCEIANLSRIWNQPMQLLQQLPPPP